MPSDNALMVPAAFRDRTSAEAAVDALQLEGIAGSDIGVAIPVREPNRIREDSAQDTLHGAVVGASIGGRLGALGGIGLAAFALGPLGVGGLFLAGAGGLLWGGTIGGLLGVVTRVRRRPDVDRWCELGLDEQSVLVVVRVHDWDREPQIAELLRGAGAVSIEDHTELDRSWAELDLSTARVSQLRPEASPAPAQPRRARRGQSRVWKAKPG